MPTRGHRGHRGHAGPFRQSANQHPVPAYSAALSEIRVIPDLRPPAEAVTAQEALIAEKRVLEGQGLNGYWIDRGRQLTWDSPANLPAVYGSAGIPGVFSVIYRAVWETPLFDLREDLYYYTGEAGAVHPIQKNALFGIEWMLHVHITGQGYAGGAFPLQSNPRLRVYYMEKGHPNQPSQSSFFTARQNITTGFVNGNESVDLPFVPLGPLRYWGVALIFDLVQPLGDPLPNLPDQPVSIYGSVH